MREEFTDFGVDRRIRVNWDDLIYIKPRQGKSITKIEKKGKKYVRGGRGDNGTRI